MGGSACVCVCGGDGAGRGGKRGGAIWTNLDRLAVKVKYQKAVNLMLMRKVCVAAVKLSPNVERVRFG